jgi:hypothetical protein
MPQPLLKQGYYWVAHSTAKEMPPRVAFLWIGEEGKFFWYVTGGRLELDFEYFSIIEGPLYAPIRSDGGPIEGTTRFERVLDGAHIEPDSNLETSMLEV